MTKNIPFLDLISPHMRLEEDLIRQVRETLHTSHFIGGPEVELFEREFARFCDVRYCIGVSSGTDALRFALIAAGVKDGDMVITVPNTFIATTEAISQAGAIPQFIDIEETTYNISPDKIKEYMDSHCLKDTVTRKTIHRATGRPVTAIVPVHLYGQMADMDAIQEIASSYDLMIIEDACQAHGAEYYSRANSRWERAGSIGTAAAFSFYPGKNLGACGEGGAVTTNDEGIAKTIRMIRDHGQSRKYYHEMEGYNGRLDAIQAGILRIKLAYLREWNENRRRNAGRYNTLLHSIEALQIPFVPSWALPVFHLYVIRIKERDELQKFLTQRGIGTGLHYPVPLHLQRAYAQSGYRKGDLPIAEQLAGEILSLPMYPDLSDEQIVDVVDSIQEFLSVANQRTQPAS